MAVLGGLMLAIAASPPATASAVTLQGLELRYHHDLMQTAPLLLRTIRAAMPSLGKDLLPHEDEFDQYSCVGHVTPRTFALLVGVNEYPALPRSNWLLGPEADVALMAGRLEDSGVAAERIIRLTGTDATRVNMASAFETLLDEVRCEDRVIIHASGHGDHSGALIKGALNLGTPHQIRNAWVQLAGGEDGRVADLAEAALEDLASRRRGRNIDDAIAQATDGLTTASRIEAELLRIYMSHGLQSPLAQAATILGPDDDGGLQYVFAIELAEFALRVRARGAHAINFLDVDSAGGMRLLDRQLEKGFGEWRYAYGSDEAPAPFKSGSERLGDFVALYAAAHNQSTVEFPLPRGADDAVPHGLFTFQIVTQLGLEPLTTPQLMTEGIASHYKEMNRTRPNFQVETTNPQLVLIPEAAKNPAPEGNPIRILSPAPTRGAYVIEQERVDIEGVVDWTAPLVGLFINNRETRFDPSGHFQGELELNTGINRITVNAITADARLHSTQLEFSYQGDQAALAGDGRRFAVLIANQTYSPSTGFASLATPVADAQAVAEVLTRRFGFKTEIRHQGRQQPLFLVDPDQRTILRTLNMLAAVANPRDDVLIFYAGHGVSDQRLGSSAWVPADAEIGFQESFLASTTLANALSRFDAGNVIVIADSCYAGGLFRSGEAVADLMASDETRITSLLRQKARASRVVITSGNDEPVLDQGGAGHSIFARALLIGLEETPYEAFSARELFDRYLRQQVSGVADQEPQFYELMNVGHLGGDFVFVQAEENSLFVSPAE